MTAVGFLRGHRVVWDGDEWRFDDGSIAAHNRACVACGLSPTLEGYDACLGYIEGATSVCCGHGGELGYVVAETEAAK